MAVTKYLKLNNNSIARVASCAYHSNNLYYGTSNLPGGHDRDYCYDQGVEGASSALNLSKFWDACSVRPAASSEDISYITNYVTADVYNSDTFKQKLASVLAGCSFVFGSISNGGFGFVNVEGNIRCFWYQGTLSRLNGGVTEYAISFKMSGISYGGNSIPRNHIEDCVLCCIDNGNLRHPSLILWCSNKTYLDRNMYFELRAGISPAYSWYPVVADKASIYTNNVGYMDSIATNPIPVRPWYIDNAYIILASTNDIADFYDDLTWGDAEVDVDDIPDYDGGTTDEQGGYGEFPEDSLPNDFEDLDEIDEDGISSGFITLYHPTRQQMTSFNDWLWTDLTDTLSQQIKRVIANPMEAILFIALAHISPPAGESAKEIKFCGIGTGVYSKYLTKRFKQYDCGSLTIKGDTLSFLDFQPYSKCEIYLPAIGYKELDINDVIDSEITLKYSVDWLSGGCLAQLRMTRGTRRSDGDAELDHNILYEFQGNIYSYLPIAASDWKSFYSNLISGVSGLAGMLSGSPQAIAGGIANIAGNVMSQQVSVQKSGSVSTSYGYMAQQDIPLFITRPILAEPTNFSLYKGYTSNIYRRIGDVKGYIEIDDSTLWIGTKEVPEAFNGITEDEAEMLRAICRSGFYN